MQEINVQVRNNVRSSLLPFLQANAPIRNIEAKALFLRQLGYTKEQFGFSDSGVSKIEILIGNEFFRLKKMGQVEQDGWVWKILSNAPVVNTPTPVVNAPVEQEQVEQENPVQIQEMVVVATDDNHQVIATDDSNQVVADEQVIVSLDDLINPALNNRLLSCDGYRNSIIESTACYGNYDKNQCNGCLLAFWCSPFTTQKKEEKKAERQAKKQIKTAKETLLDKYADKRDNLTNLLNLIGTAVEIVNGTETTTNCMFNSAIQIAPFEKCMFVRNFGILSIEIYNEIKNAGIV